MELADTTRFCHACFVPDRPIRVISHLATSAGTDCKKFRHFKSCPGVTRRNEPGAPIGNRNARKHGGYSASAMAAARYLKMIARIMRGGGLLTVATLDGALGS